MFEVSKWERLKLMLVYECICFYLGNQTSNILFISEDYMEIFI